MVPTHQRIDWRHDVPASIVVFLVAVPLCLGIALASGAPLFSGIIAGIVGALVVAPLSGSALMVSGPAAGLTAIVLAAVTDLGDYRGFLVAVVLAGLLQIILGALRAGIIGYYFPSAVIKGMLSGIGLILILKQFPHALGYDTDAMGDEAFLEPAGSNTFTSLARALGTTEPGALLISIVGLLLLFLWPRLPLARFKLLPAPLMVVVAAVVANDLFAALIPEWSLGGRHLVNLPTPGSLGEWTTHFASPAWSFLHDPDVWRIALTLAIIASLETLLSLEATDKMDPHKREAPPNRELLAQGVGNTVSGLIGGLPITGVIVRSAANVAAGARTRWSAILHGVLLIFCVVALPMLLNRIPLAALAAILLHTGWKLAHPDIFRGLWTQGYTQWLPYVATIAVILVSDLLVGISVGLGLALFFILRNMLQSPPFRVTSPAGAVLRRLELHPHLNFLNKGALLEALEALPEGSRVELDGRRVENIDPDVREVLLNFAETARLRQIDYRLVSVPGISTPTATP